MRKLTTTLFLAATVAVWVACGGANPFAPTKHQPTDPDPTGPGPAPPATGPEQLMLNLSRAMNTRDKDLYESLIDEDFWFTETDCTGELIWENGLEEELEFIGGSRDGTKPGIFDIYRDEFIFEFTLINRSVELGIDHPLADEVDPNGHPTEDWEIFRGRSEILMTEITDEEVNGFRVDQIMTYKLREVAPAGDDSIAVWKIRRWVDDPLSGDCGEATDPIGKLAPDRSSGLFSWAAIKEQLGH